ncbi:hypothetical protein GCM10022234_28960 [Aeromicrobium panaciterrae]
MVISRRALIATGAGAVVLAGAVVVADATHRLDDAADAVGLRPKARPVRSDDALIVAVAKDQNRVLSAIESTAAKHTGLGASLEPFATIAQAHVNAVGGPSTVPPARPVDADPVVALRTLATTLSSASTARAKDAAKAVSPDLARVLSSMSAGLAQCSRGLGALA